MLTLNLTNLRILYMLKNWFLFCSFHHLHSLPKWPHVVSWILEPVLCWGYLIFTCPIFTSSLYARHIFELSTQNLPWLFNRSNNSYFLISFSVSIYMNPSTFLSAFPEKDIQNLLTFHYPTILAQTNHLSFVLVSHNWPQNLSLLHYSLYSTHSCHHVIINTDQLMSLFSFRTIQLVYAFPHSSPYLCLNDCKISTTA